MPGGDGSLHIARSCSANRGVLRCRSASSSSPCVIAPAPLAPISRAAQSRSTSGVGSLQPCEAGGTGAAKMAITAGLITRAEAVEGMRSGRADSSGVNGSMELGGDLFSLFRRSHSLVRDPARHHPQQSLLLRGGVSVGEPAIDDGRRCAGAARLGRYGTACWRRRWVKSSGRRSPSAMARASRPGAAPPLTAIQRGQAPGRKARVHEVAL